MSHDNIPATAFSGTVTPNEPAHYNNWAHEPILGEHFNKLRARLLNLAETSTRDKQQADAMKGLIKDFVNTAFYDSIHGIESFLRDKGIIQAGEGQCGSANYLRARSLADILYEPYEPVG